MESALARLRYLSKTIALVKNEKSARPCEEVILRLCRRSNWKGFHLSPMTLLASGGIVGAEGVRVW